MKRNAVVTLAVCSLLLSCIISGTLWAKDIEEKLTVTPSRTITSSEEQAISSTALKVLRHIAQARADIHEKDVNHANAELRLSQTLIDIIKAALPTENVKDRIWVAKKHLSYEDTETIKQDLVPIYSSLDEIQDLVPVEKSRDHINNAMEYLKKGNKEGAKEELKLADESLLYSEVDLPLAYTERHITAALGFLERNDAKKADEALKLAENGVQFISIDINSPVAKAKKSLWQASRNFSTGELAAAKRDLKEAKIFLGKAVKVGEAETRAEAEKLVKDIEAVEGKVDKGVKETGQEINNLYERVKALTLSAVNVFQAGGNQAGEDIDKAMGDR